MRTLTPILLIGLLLGGGSGVLRAEPAPEFALPVLDGAELRLGKLRGQVVLLDFWASWCAPCARSLPAYAALQGEFGERGLRVLAVNLDEREADARAFLQRRPLALNILLDPAGGVAEQYQLKGMPTALLIDRRGQIRHRWVGYDASELPDLRVRIETLLTESP